MQVQQIQRPQLFNDFFHLLITWSNEVIDFIQTSNNVTSYGFNSVNLYTRILSRIMRNVKIKVNFILQTSIYFIRRLL